MANEATKGWYPDPADRSQLRWWDGAQWTEDVWRKAEDTSDDEQAGLNQGQPGHRRLVLIGSVFVGLVLVGAGAALVMWLTDPMDRSGASAPGSGPADTSLPHQPEGAQTLDQDPQAPRYAEMARQLRLGEDEAGDFIWAANYGQLEQMGFIDRSVGIKEGQVIPEAVGVLSQRYPYHTSLPFLWATIRSRTFAWPDTKPVLGFSLMDADVAVWSGTSSAFRLQDGTEDVTAILSQEPDWDGPLSAGNGTWEWTGLRGLLDTDESTDEALAELLTQESSGTPYQVQVADGLVFLSQSVENPTKPFLPAIDLLEQLRTAPLAIVFDPRERLQQDDREEPPGGYLGRIEAAGLTMSWPDGEPVEELHLLMTDPSAARAATAQLRTTINEDSDFAEAVGSGASVTSDGAMVTLTAGATSTSLSATISRPETEGGPKSVLLDAFATGEPLPPVDG